MRVSTRGISAADTAAATEERRRGGQVGRGGSLNRLEATVVNSRKLSESIAATYVIAGLG